MKKAFLIAVSLICVAVICSSLIISPDNKAISVSEVPKTEVVSVENDLLSMLNHNFVYGSDFDSADNMVNLSMNALLGLKDENDEYIKAGIVTDFVNNMYGVDVVDISKLNADYPHKDGYVFVVPGGFTKYRHSNIKLSYNEDGTISAQTDVTVVDHDAIGTNLLANSLFVPNNNSAFGYNIIYSEIVSGGTAI